ncbi:NADH-quinone oxidoreductase subunit NuoG [Pantoea sp. Mhis]|uniref:NADH-quinone oxidoreductase subunit NuoG n=1 Tax=Pantoea sp. Mhis TaxID=2576759 RepID=UPI0013596550|nr:NADH-quinone oxidoreductase subunit NuoG [Pantoea sp. Mhis]MXP56096.1 NADH-quinone oxidoreductase subunit NuoG [Pantoea sp. Mhis]
MVMIYVDGKEYNVNAADNLLQACLSMDLNIPYFCWHPALGSVGACRQCAVKQFESIQDKRGRIIMSCMTPVLNNTLISINDKEAKEFRASVIEWLMINHPHDCPICEEGGHCHLQDMTVMTSHNLRRYRFNKKIYHNQDLGPFISHAMNRCIVCYRCVRYYKDYADGKDLGVYGAHDNIYFGRLKDGMLENEFSGNLVEICPTGVFTDKTHSEHYNRKWDMQFAPSICHHCCVGCNISAGERYGELRRIENRYNGSVNYYFLCDRGRFGYGYVNRKDRPRYPQKINGINRIKLTAEQIVSTAADILRQSKRIIGIGSPRASIESNFALRELVGKENFSIGISADEQNCLNLIIQILKNSGIYTPSLREIETYDVILVLGEDVTQVAARIALSIRQAVKAKAREMSVINKIADWQSSAILNIGQNAKYPLFITNVDETRLDDIATWTYYAPVENQARLGFAIANKLDNNAPPVDNFDKELVIKINSIVKALTTAKKPLIISGMHSGSSSLIEASANIAKALKVKNINVGITLLVPEANSIGLGLIGGLSLDSALKQITKKEADTLIVLENDLYRYATQTKVNIALENIDNIIVIDHQQTQTLKKANLVFSSSTFAEGDGTLINYEGRAQRFFQVYDPSYYDNSIIVLEGWRWLHALYGVVNNCLIHWTCLDEVIDSVIVHLPHLKKIKDAAPNAKFRIHGQKLARLPHRASGRTAARAHINVHEPRQPQDKDTMFAFSMEGSNQPNENNSQIPFVWSPGWNSPQAWNKFQEEIGGKLHNGDPGIRLFEINHMSLPWFTNIPPYFSAVNQWHVAPYYRLFGSEEMSQRSPIFQKIMSMSPTNVVINSLDAKKMGLKNGSIIELICKGEKLRLPVHLSSLLHSGLLGLTLGMPGIPTCLSGAEIKIL